MTVSEMTCKETNFMVNDTTLFRIYCIKYHHRYMCDSAMPQRSMQQETFPREAQALSNDALGRYDIVIT